MSIYVVVILFSFACRLTQQNDEDQCFPLRSYTLPNGKIQHLSGNRLYFVCDESYRLRGPKIIRCYKGKWSTDLIPKCSQPGNVCRAPGPFSNGQILGDDWHIGNEIYYVCNPGFQLTGTRNRTCLRSGYWNGIPPTCQYQSNSLANIATDIKNQFITKTATYSSDNIGRSIGRNVDKIGLELVLLIDRSSSVDPVDFTRGIEFVKFLINQFGVRNGNNDAGTRIAVITFGDEAEIVVNLNDEKIQNRQDAKNLLDNLQPNGGGTAMANALLLIPLHITKLLREKAKRVIFLLTDGYNNIPSDLESNEIAELLKKDHEFEIYAFGIGQHIHRDELYKIVSEPLRDHLFILNQYSDLSDIIKFIISDEPEPAPPAPEVNKCGKLPDSPMKKMVENWPWLAAIFVEHPPNKNSRIPKMGICAGALICRQWVLTSASCFYGETHKTLEASTKNVYVTLGEFNLVSNDKAEKNFYAIDVILHPEFDPSKQNDLDVALVKLNEPAPLTYTPICLPVLRIRNSKRFMAGWGTTPNEVYFEQNFVSAFVVKSSTVEMSFLQGSDCKRFSSRLFCARSTANLTCRGNLGSPLVVQHPTTQLYNLIGILSRRDLCSTHYSVFTFVRYSRQWVGSVTESCYNN